MRLLVGAPQPLDRDVCVDLRGGQAGVAEHLLNRPKICAAFEQMCGRAMPQTVRSHVGGLRHVLQNLMYRSANLTRVNPATSSAQEQRRATALGDHLSATELQPSLNRSGRRQAEGDRPLLGSLAHDPYQER